MGRLRRDLSARHLVVPGAGVVIGPGISTLTGVRARNTAGPAVVVSVAIAGVVALLLHAAYGYRHSRVGRDEPVRAAGT